MGRTGRRADSGDFDYIFHIHLGTSSPLLYGPKNDEIRHKNVKKNLKLRQYYNLYYIQTTTVQIPSFTGIYLVAFSPYVDADEFYRP